VCYATAEEHTFTVQGGATSVKAMWRQARRALVDADKKAITEASTSAGREMCRTGGLIKDTFFQGPVQVLNRLPDQFRKPTARFYTVEVELNWTCQIHAELVRPGLGPNQEPERGPAVIEEEGPAKEAWVDGQSPSNHTRK